MAKLSQKEHEFKLQKLKIFQSLSPKRKLSVKEFNLAMFLVRKGACNFCDNGLAKDKVLATKYAEIEHTPRVHL